MIREQAIATLRRVAEWEDKAVTLGLPQELAGKVIEKLLTGGVTDIEQGNQILKMADAWYFVAIGPDFRIRNLAVATIEHLVEERLRSSPPHADSSSNRD